MSLAYITNIITCIRLLILIYFFNSGFLPNLIELIHPLKYTEMVFILSVNIVIKY